MYIDKQLAQLTPPAPHTKFVRPCWHTPALSQHPIGQVFPLHTPASSGAEQDCPAH
jgi:hypothetical protein